MNGDLIFKLKFDSLAMPFAIRENSFVFFLSNKSFLFYCYLFFKINEGNHENFVWRFCEHLHLYIEI